MAEADGPVGLRHVEDDWLDDLYVAARRGPGRVGSALLDLVKALRPGGFCLWVFESNTPARAFYRKHGLVELERTDGSANEERAPDVRMAWPGADPLAFFRGLIDEVDAQLGDLLARRVALTRAVQEHKRAAVGSTERDLRPRARDRPDGWPAAPPRSATDRLRADRARDHHRRVPATPRTPDRHRSGTGCLTSHKGVPRGGAGGRVGTVTASTDPHQREAANRLHRPGTPGYRRFNLAMMLAGVGALRDPVRRAAGAAADHRGVRGQPHPGQPGGRPRARARWPCACCRRAVAGRPLGPGPHDARRPGPGRAAHRRWPRWPRRSAVLITLRALHRRGAGRRGRGRRWGTSGRRCTRADSARRWASTSPATPSAASAAGCSPPRWPMRPRGAVAWPSWRWPRSRSRSRSGGCCRSRSHSTRTTSADRRHRWAGSAPTPGVWALAAIPFLLMGGFVAVYNYLGYRLLAEPFSLPLAVAGLVFLAYLAGSLSSAVAGRLADSMGRPRVLVAAVLVMARGAGADRPRPAGARRSWDWWSSPPASSPPTRSPAAGCRSVAAPYRTRGSALYVCGYYAGSSVFGALLGLAWTDAGWTGVAAGVGALIGARAGRRGGGRRQHEPARRRVAAGRSGSTPECPCVLSRWSRRVT